MGNKWEGVKLDTPPKMGKCQGAARRWSNMSLKEGGVPRKAHHMAGVLSPPVFRSSLIHMTFLNIEPLSINTHMQKAALPSSSLRPRPRPLCPPASSGRALLVKAREGSREK